MTIELSNNLETVASIREEDNLEEDSASNCAA